MYVANEKRYDKMQYNRLGKSGLKLPAVSLGFWHNFGDNAQYSNMKELCFMPRDYFLLVGHSLRNKPTKRHHVKGSTLMWCRLF